MPRYSYTCTQCAEPFQVRLSYAELDTAQPECPTCGGTDCQRGLSKVSVKTNSAAGAASSGSSCSSGSCAGCSGCG